MNKLNVFTIEGIDTFVARDKVDAVRAWEEHTGENEEDYYILADGNIEKLSEETEIRVILDKDYVPFFSTPIRWKRYGDWQLLIIATAGQWIAANGRGFLCSTEY